MPELGGDAEVLEPGGDAEVHEGDAEVLGGNAEVPVAEGDAEVLEGDAEVPGSGAEVQEGACAGPSTKGTQCFAIHCTNYKNPESKRRNITFHK